ncbi:unnamed protein product [Euphydryas editha]|uniref:Bis(5'-nucleosyl)-tetraphosphatase [asymmetrical] n=1 Tax=Euphydryas editha TaxID=104508 RepID=A0AAU9TRY4_EUPED|nr:unnamed protein product [Euphydryas editha]
MLGRGDPACQGMSCTSLPRRLPFGQPRPIQVMSSGLGGREALGKSGLDSQLPEIDLNSDTRPRIPWHPLANCKEQDDITGKEDTHSQSNHSSIIKKRPDHASRIAKPTGTGQLRQLCHTPRQVTLSESTSLSSTFQQETTTTEETNPLRGVSRDEVVARRHTSLFGNTQKAGYSFPSDGRFGSGLGCSSKWASNVGNLVSSTTGMAQQQERAICSNGSDQSKRRCAKQIPCTRPIGQSNLNCIYSERGRNEIVDTTRVDIQTINPNRPVQDNSIGTLPAREVQHNSRQIVTRERGCGMASIAPSNWRSLQEMGSTRNRSLCFPTKCRSKKLRFNRLQRSISKLYRCLQQTLAIPTSVGIPPTEPITQSFVTSKPRDRDVFGSGTGVASSFLAARSEVQSVRSPTRNTESIENNDRYDNITTTATSTSINLESLENWGWGSQIKEWSTQERELLKNSWRQSTLATYLPAIKRWLKWCNNSQVNPKSPNPTDIAKFLIFLFLNENLSYSTILVHKSAILTFCGPYVEQQAFTSFIIKHTLKAIGVGKPKLVRPLITWDPRIVLEWLSANSPKETLFEISRRTATVLLLVSGRRVHDLTLLRISKGNYLDDGQNIYLIPAFGSKTDRHDYRQSAWKLSKHPDKNICPVSLVRCLIEITKQRRSDLRDLDNLFITICNKVKSASRTVIGNWVRTVLKDSGIDATPGSCRSAVASLGWLDNQPLDDILARGNWKSSTTFFNHYCKIIEVSKNDRHVDPGESDWVTALRETKEEAGLSENDLEIYKNISHTLNYEVKGKPKAVVYWLAKIKDPNQKVTLSDEHQDLKWLPLKEAQEISGFEDMKKLLAEFHEKALKIV